METKHYTNSLTLKDRNGFLTIKVGVSKEVRGENKPILKYRFYEPLLERKRMVLDQGQFIRYIFDNDFIITSNLKKEWTQLK